MGFDPRYPRIEHSVEKERRMSGPGSLLLAYCKCIVPYPRDAEATISMFVPHIIPEIVNIGGITLFIHNT